MTDFKYIDSTAYAADFPLDSFLIRRSHENIKAVREHRGRLGAFSAGTLDTSSGAALKPQVSGYLQRSLIPFLWHLAPNVTEIKVAVRHRVTTSRAASGYEVKLSAFAVELGHLLDGDPLPDGQTSDLSGGATSSTTTTLTLDVSSLSKGWIVVCVGVLSGEAAAVEITKSSGTHGPDVYSGYTGMFHVCDHNADLGTTATVIDHWGLLVKAASGGKASDTIGGRSMLRYEYDSSGALSTDLTYRLFVYPQFPPHRAFVNSTATATDSLWYVPLGILDLEGVTIYDSGVSHPQIGATADANQPAGPRNLVPRVGEQNQFFLENTRVHHMGPSQNPSEADFTTTGPVNRLSGSRSLTTAYQDICSCVVGRGDLYEQGGTNYRRLVYTMRALVLATYPTQDPGDPVRFDIGLQLLLSDPNLGNTGGQVLSIPQMACIRSPINQYNTIASTIGTYGNIDASRYDSLAYLYGFGTQFATGRFVRNTLRGTLPESDMGRRNLYDIEIAIKDPQALITRRVATLQAKMSTGSTSTGLTPEIEGQAPRLHVLTWTVITTPEGEEVPATELGA